MTLLRHVNATIFCLLFLFTAFVSGNDSISVSPEIPESGGVNISRIKAAHYRRLGIDILPEYIADTTIGPGRIVAITNITVQKKALLTILPGTIIMFEPQRCLIVEGTLSGASDATDSILLTNVPINTRYIKIAIADSLWNGIIVKPEGTLILNSVIIGNAATGITSASKVRTIEFSCVNMKQNVKTHCIIDDTTISFSNAACISTADILSRSIPISQGEQPSAPTIPMISTDKKNNTTAFIRTVSCIVTVMGIGVTAYGAWRYNNYTDLYNEATDPSNHSPSQIDNYKEKAIRGQHLATAGGVLGILGISGIVFTFMF